MLASHHINRALHAVVSDREGRLQIHAALLRTTRCTPPDPWAMLAHYYKEEQWT